MIGALTAKHLIQLISFNTKLQSIMVQYSPFITLCLGFIGMEPVIFEL